MDDNVFASFKFSAAARRTQRGGNQSTGHRIIKEEFEEDVANDDIKPQTVASDCDRSVAPTYKRRKLTVKKEQFVQAGATAEGSLGYVKSESKLEIEDSDDLVTRSIVKVEPAPTALKVSQSRSEVDGSPKESAPESWEQIVEKIRFMRMDKDAPVDLLGTHQLFDVEANKETQQFQVLVAAMISSQTRDAVTGAAMQRLRAIPGGLNISQIASDAMEVDALAEILKPVGFYRQKAKFMKSIARTLSAPPHNGAVPNSLEELMQLPGVGPKVGLLVLWVAFGIPISEKVV